jgi:AraC-like DNA-binding protein
MAKLKSGFRGERAIVIPSPIIEELKNDALGSLLHITDIGYYPKATFHFRKRTKEEAKQYILIYCIEGSGWFEIEGIRQKVSPEHFFILPKGKAHAYGCSSTNPWTIYWLHFDGEKAGFFSEGLDKPTPVSPQKDSRIEDRLQLFEEIFATLKNGYSKNNLDYSISGLFHFLGSLKFLGAYRESIFTNQNEDVSADAIHFMRENIHKRLTLKEIADHVGFSTSHFSTLFQKKTGFSPLNYLSQLKIQQACHWLDFSDMKINQIALTIGFDDPFYFSRVFTKTMGVSPTEYRSKKKG